MRHARLGEALFGASLLAVGFFALYKASALPTGSLREPDSGLFPLAIAVVLTVFAALSLSALGRPGPAQAAERSGVVRVLVLIASLGVYAWLLPRAGFLLCTLVLLALVLRGLGRAGRIVTALASVGGTLGCYYLFTRLGLPLPAGYWGF
jgi:hypothetical protein